MEWLQPISTVDVSRDTGDRVRVRTDDRRQAILEVALKVFQELGYERASMAMISRQLGGSKGTLYGYFKSKEELFETTMKAASQGPGDQIMDLLDSRSDDLRGVLERFGRAYVHFILGTEVLAITRTAIHEGSGSSLGPHLFEQGPGRALPKMTAFFRDAMKRGKMPKRNPAVAALHLKGLLEAGFLENALYGAETGKDLAIGEAVDTFLRAYGS